MFASLMLGAGGTEFFLKKQYQLYLIPIFKELMAQKAVIKFLCAQE